MDTISVKRGDSFRATFSFVDGDSPANLTGCTAQMQIRDRSLALFVEASTDDYLSIDVEAGAVYADIPGSLMDIALGKYQTDVQLTFADGAVRSSPTVVVKVVQDMTFSE